MIVDVTNEVFTVLKQTLTDVTVLSAYPSVAPSFPCMVVEEIINTTFNDTHDTSGDHHGSVTIEINIFSNAENKISQVKNIRNRIDVIMADTYRMNREDSRPVTNYSDDNIYRYVLRYSFIIDENKTIYRG